MGGGRGLAARRLRARDLRAGSKWERGETWKGVGPGRSRRGVRHLYCMIHFPWRCRARRVAAEGSYNAVKRHASASQSKHHRSFSYNGDSRTGSYRPRGGRPLSASIPLPPLDRPSARILPCASPCLNSRPAAPSAAPASTNL